MFCCYRLGQSGVLSGLRRQCFELDKATYIKGNSIEYFIMFMSCIHSVSILFSKKFPQLTMRKFIIHFSIVLPFLVSIFFQVLLKQNEIIFYCVTQYRKMPSNFLECMLFKLVTFVNCLLNLLRISVLKFEFNKKVSTGTYLLNTF